MFKSTKNPKIEEMTKSFKARALQLSRYPVVPTPEGKRMCLWCGEVELKGSKLKKYCSPECSEAIFTWAQPQKGNGLHCLLVRQSWKCNICKLSWEPVLLKVTGYFNRKNWLVPNFGRHSSERFMKIFKQSCVPEQKPEVDHITPIYKGGVSLGLDNHQAICYSCHKIKSKVDNSGPRKAKNEQTK